MVRDLLGHQAFREVAVPGVRSPLLLLEDGVDGDLFGGAGAEVTRGGAEEGMPEQALEPGDIGAALAQPGGMGRVAAGR